MDITKKVLIMYYLKTTHKKISKKNLLFLDISNLCITFEIQKHFFMKNKISELLPNPTNLHFNYGSIINYQSKFEPAYYYVAINKELPDVINFHESFKIQELLQAIIEKYNCEKENIWQYSYHSRSEKIIKLDVFCVVITNDLMLYCDDDACETKIYFSNITEKTAIDELVALIKTYLQEETIVPESKIFLLYENKGLYLQDFKVKEYPMSLEENYNDDFMPIHQVIVDRLNKQDDKGIVLLHGTPGTGKTSYIRHLTSLIAKKMIYIPPDFAYKIASPDFLPLLIDNPNSVLIIEDAENIIETRDSSRNMSVSNLLNLADGLLSDCLNIQILCTFNTNINKIDKALLRKGRLIASYEFKPLSNSKAQVLSDKLGYTSKIKKEMTLTDVYNQKEKSFDEDSNPDSIGFLK